MSAHRVPSTETRCGVFSGEFKKTDTLFDNEFHCDGGLKRQATPPYLQLSCHIIPWTKNTRTGKLSTERKIGGCGTICD